MSGLGACRFFGLLVLLLGRGFRVSGFGSKDIFYCGSGLMVQDALQGFGISFRLKFDMKPSFNPLSIRVRSVQGSGLRLGA